MIVEFVIVTEKQQYFDDREDLPDAIVKEYIRLWHEVNDNRADSFLKHYLWKNIPEDELRRFAHIESFKFPNGHPVEDLDLKYK